MLTSASTKKTAKPKLALAVQYVTAVDYLPTRSQVRRWVRAALTGDAEITVRFVAAEEGRALNRDYRGKDYATNVLSFAYESAPAGGSVCGDLVLCTPVVALEAQQQQKSLNAHYAHLVVHGVLHLQGFDHETEAQAQVMEARERTIVMRLGFVDPYSDGDK